MVRQRQIMNYAFESDVIRQVIHKTVTVDGSQEIHYTTITKETGRLIPMQEGEAFNKKTLYQVVDEKQKQYADEQIQEAHEILLNNLRPDPLPELPTLPLTPTTSSPKKRGKRKAKRTEAEDAVADPPAEAITAPRQPSTVSIPVIKTEDVIIKQEANVIVVAFNDQPDCDNDDDDCVFVGRTEVEEIIIPDTTPISDVTSTSKDKSDDDTEPQSKKQKQLESVIPSELVQVELSSPRNVSTNYLFNNTCSNDEIVIADVEIMMQDNNEMKINADEQAKLFISRAIEISPYNVEICETLFELKADPTNVIEHRRHIASTLFDSDLDDNIQIDDIQVDEHHSIAFDLFRYTLVLHRRHKIHQDVIQLIQDIFNYIHTQNESRCHTDCTFEHFFMNLRPCMKLLLEQYNPEKLNLYNVIVTNLSRRLHPESDGLLRSKQLQNRQFSRIQLNNNKSLCC